MGFFNVIEGFSERLSMPHYNNARDYMKFGQYEQAIKELDEAIRVYERYNYYYERASTYIELKQYEKAVSDCNKSLELDSDNSVAYFYRGKAYFEIGEYEKVI